VIYKKHSTYYAILLSKVKFFVISYVRYKLMESYFRNRYHRVVILILI